MSATVALTGWNITPEARLACGESLNNMSVAVSAGAISVIETATKPGRQLVFLAALISMVVKGDERVIKSRERIAHDIEVITFRNGHRFVFLQCVTAKAEHGLLVVTFTEWELSGRQYVAMSVEDPPREFVGEA